MHPHDPAGLLPKDRTSKKWLVSGVIAAAVAVTLTFGIMLTKQEASRQVSAAPESAAQVVITGAGFDIAELQIQKGQSVVWEVQDNEEHQLALTPASQRTAGFGADVRFGQGQSYSYAFDETGTFYYYDTLNPQQFKGKITVIE